LKNNEITFFKLSDNGLNISLYKGRSVLVDDNLVTATPAVYIAILLGPGAVGFVVSEPELDSELKSGARRTLVPAAVKPHCTADSTWQFTRSVINSLAHQ
jgi:hypothetical protein